MSQKAKNIKGPSEPKEVLGSGITPKVVEQFIARENLISQFKKDKNHLSFFNANGAWARIVSSVNTLTEEETLKLATGEATVNSIRGSHALAYNNVIMGGTLKQGTPSETTSLRGGVNQQRHSPVNIDSKGYITPGDIKNAAYHNYENLGFRPSPGITSVNVKSKGTYGTLREAEVSVTVWDLQDLEMMQALYLRPGYTILLEWGHSLQLDSETGEVRKDIELYRKFVQGREKTSDIETALLGIREESNYNYDAMFGYVSNFSWSFRKDGGYDCTIKIISKGSVLESISATFDPSTVYPAEQMRSSQTEAGKDERKSIFHKLLIEMKDFDSESFVDPLTAARFAPIVIPNPIVAARVVKSTFSDFFFGNTNLLLSNLETTDTAEGQLAMQNEAFTAKLRQILSNTTTTINGDTYSWTDEDGLMSLDGDEVVAYLNREFSQYGFTAFNFNSNENRVNIQTTGNRSRVSLTVEADNFADQDDLNETIRLAEFLQENAMLPAEELTDEQLAQRLERDRARQAREAEQLKNAAEVRAKDTKRIKGTDLPKVYTVSNFTKPTAQHFKEVLSNFAAFRIKNVEDDGTGTIDDDDLNEYWIPLYVILDVFNNYISLIDQTQDPEPGSKTKGRKLVQFYTGEQDNNPQAIQYEAQAKYVTNLYHFSIDPMVCMLPKKPNNVVLTDSNGQELEWPDGNKSYPMGLVWKNAFHTSVEKAFDTGLMRGQPDDILNILVSCQYLKEEVEKVLNTNEDADKTSTTDVVSFLQSLLTGINESLGGINDLDLHFDESDDLFYIIDRRYTPREVSTLPQLTLAGTRSVISDLSIDSKISSDIGKMVSIAAQGTGGNSKDNVGPLLKWNKGLIDRHIVHKSTKNDTEGNQIEEREKPEDKRLKKWIESYYEFWEEFNGESAFDYGDYMRDLVPSLKGYHKEFCQKWVVEKTTNSPDNPIPVPGVIPIELSFTTMGISGIKIGQAFRAAPGILPVKYTEDFGYIITGLDHTVQGSKWNTNIKTQFFIAKRPSDEEVNAFEQKVPTRSASYISPTEVQQIRQNPELAEDPAPIINPNHTGATSYNNSPLAISLRQRGFENAKLPLDDSSVLVPIKRYQGAKSYYVSSQTQTPDYFLHPAAAEAYQKWKTELENLGIDLGLYSAYRNLRHQGELSKKPEATTVGSSPHGWGGAVDVAVGNVPKPRTNPANNLDVRKTETYKTIATIGSKYDWYNPWRLSDNAGVDEAWHFEYWGKV